jgi:hypothetical protein
VRVVVDAAALLAAADVNVCEALQWQAAEQRDGIAAEVLRVRPDVGDVEEHEAVRALKHLGQELRFGHLGAGPVEEDGYVLQRQRNRREQVAGDFYVLDECFDSRARARHGEQVPGFGAARADEGDVLADERRADALREVGQRADSGAVDRLGAAEGEGDAVRDDREAAFAEAVDRGGNVGAGEVLGGDFDEGEVGAAVDGQRDFGAPADAEGGCRGRARGAAHRRELGSEIGH